LEPEQVQGRDPLIRDLVERVTAHRVTALLGPRRYGKTSVLRRLVTEVTEVTTVWVDLYEVTSMADVAVRFDEGLAGTRGRFADVARRLGVEVSLHLGLLKVAFTGRAADRPEPSLAFQSLLDVLVRVAASVPTLLVIDEFSSIARVDGAAGALRTATQHHFQEIGLVFAGSHPSMMRTLFTDRPQPFYGQADLVEIGGLDLGVVEDIVTSGFESTGRRAGNLGGLIGRFAAGHPQRTMQLADACWRLTPPRGDGGHYWADGLGQVQKATADGMERLYSRFTASERGVLRAVARTGRIYGAEADLLDLSKGAASHARQTLLETGDLSVRDGSLVVVDPLMADWLRRRFPL
jgi:hypothetical protein